MEIELRDPRHEDWIHLHRWSADDETARLLAARDRPLTPEEAEIEIDRILGGQGREHHAFMIEVSGVTVGNAWLGRLDAGSASLGIVVGDPDYRGRGVGTAATRMLLQRAWRLGLRRVHLWTLVTNERALRCYRRAGFKEVRRERRDVPRTGETEVVVMEVQNDGSAAR